MVSIEVAQRQHLAAPEQRARPDLAREAKCGGIATCSPRDSISKPMKSAWLRLVNVFGTTLLNPKAAFLEGDRR
jgi:hypothetical protein